MSILANAIIAHNYAFIEQMKSVQRVGEMNGGNVKGIEFTIDSGRQLVNRRNSI